MTCQEAAPYVSVLYDGETVTPEVAQHIAGCQECRDRLNDYSRIGTELRLTASLDQRYARLPERLRAKMEHSDRGSLLKARMPSPRLAFASAVGALIAVSITVPIVRAQTESPKWFEFQLGPLGSLKHTYVVQRGYSDRMAWVTGNGSGPVNQVQARVSVTAINDGSVEIAVHAVGVPSSDEGIVKPVADALSLNGHSYRYTPGQTLEIPVDGGGTLTLRGAVVHEQPKIAWGQPLEPGSDQLIIRNPVLTSSGKVLLDAYGASAIAEDDVNGPEAVQIYSPGTGRFDFALQPFQGAVKAQANWGQLQFKIDGTEYLLSAAAPVTGGEQPHSVWVRLDAGFKPSENEQNGFIGGASLKTLDVAQ